MKKKKSATIDIDPSFGKYVRRRRKEIGLNIEELAARVGCSHTHISRIENAERCVRDINLIKALANGLDISFWALLKERIPEEFESDDPTSKNVFPLIHSKAQEKELSEMVKLIVDLNFTDSDIHFLSEFVKLYAESSNISSKF